MTKPIAKNPRVLLLEDHRHIDELLDRLRASVHADDREAMDTAWQRAEKTLLRHLDVEEVFVFPALHATQGAEVDALLREHATIRRTIGEIGLALELHTLRCEQIDSFCAVLRDHARREDACAYSYAEESLPAQVARAIATRIHETASALRGARASVGVP